jgi:hypothetical protein
MNYTIEQIQTLKLKFEKSFLNKAQVFFNLLKYTFTKRPLKSEIQNINTLELILNKVYDFNMQRYPGCFYSTTEGTINYQGTEYSTTRTERLLKKVGTKFLFQVCDTFTVNEEEITQCYQVYKDAYFIPDCQILDNPTLLTFINKIQQNAHTT